MPQPAGSLLPFLRPSLLALAIAAIAGGCSRDGNADAQQDRHEQPVPTTSERGHVADVHAAHAPAVTELPPPPATPWLSDAPLREGMRRMHRAVEALEHANHEHLDVTQTLAASGQVQDAANFMIANCNLAPEPDAALHGLLTILLSGAHTIKASPHDTTPLAAMRDAVALYPRVFEDAAWQADTAATD